MYVKMHIYKTIANMYVCIFAHFNLALHSRAQDKDFHHPTTTMFEQNRGR